MLEKYNLIERTLAGVALLVLILAGGLQVLFRYVFHVPIAWAEELIIFCSIWSVYLGASAATNEGKHIMVGIIVDNLPPKPKFFISLISQCLWLLCSAGLVITGWMSAYSVFLRGAKTVGGKFPYWVAMIAVVVGMALMSLRVLSMIALTLKTGGRSVSETRPEEGPGL